jgi:hypothetical protein
MTTVCRSLGCEPVTRHYVEYYHVRKARMTAPANLVEIGDVVNTTWEKGEN